MTTPYDTAMRVSERRLDRIRTAIAQAVEQLERIGAEHVAAETALIREGSLAAHDHRLATDRYFREKRDHRARLGDARADAHARLEALRREAAERFGERAALDTAVVRYRDEAARAAAAVEQAATDDLTGARHCHPRRRAARLTVAGASPP